MKRTLWILPLALAALLALDLPGDGGGGDPGPPPASGATYVNPLQMKYEAPGGSAVLDTVITTASGAADSLTFGKIMDWCVIYTDASESMRRKWIFWDPSGAAKLIQTKGTTPTAAVGRKGRYGALRYSSVFDTLNATGGESSPIYALGAIRGVYYGGVGAACTFNLQAGTGAPPWGR